MNMWTLKKHSITTILLFSLPLFAESTPFTVKPPTIKQGIHTHHWESALITQKVGEETDSNDSDWDTIGDDRRFDKDIDIDVTVDEDVIDTNDTLLTDSDMQQEDDMEISDIIETPDDNTVVAVVPHQAGRKWGEWYGTTHFISPQKKQKNSTQLKLHNPPHSLNPTELPPSEQLINGFSVSLWGDSSLIISAGANYTWRYLYSSVSFGTDMYTPAMNRPYFLRIHTGGSYPFSDFLVRTDVGYRLNLNPTGEGASHFRQHQLEFRAAAGYRFNSWLLLVGGTGLGYGFDEKNSGKLSPLFYGGIELF